jgi:hypothetical protein
MTLPSEAEVDHAGDCLDVVGMVLRVGTERIVRSGSFFHSYRWVNLCDSTGKSVNLQLFATSQSDEFDTMLVGMVLACTKVDITTSGVLGDADDDSQPFWLRTTRYLPRLQLCAWMPWYGQGWDGVVMLTVIANARHILGLAKLPHGITRL